MTEQEIYDKNIETIFEDFCENKSQQLCENYLSTTSIFLASIDYMKKILASGIRDENYIYCKGLLELVNKILGKFGIDNKYHHLLDKGVERICFDNRNYYDPGKEWEMDSPKAESNEVLQKLISGYKSTNKKQNIAELLYACFNDKNHLYNLYKFFTFIADEQMKHNAKEENASDQLIICNVPDLYDEMLVALDRFSEPQSDIVKKLEEIPFLTNVNKYVMNNPVIAVGVDEYIKTLEMGLLSKTKRSSILVGLAGTGKSTIVYELAQRINKKQLHENLNKLKIFELSLSGLTAGSSLVGSLENKIMSVFNLVKQDPNVILFIDEIHLINSGTMQTLDAASIIKPFLTKKEIAIIGATTEAEYNKHIIKDKAFARRFRKVIVNEPSKAETIEILQKIKPEYNAFFNKELKDELIKKIVDLAENYSVGFANPDKSISFFELAYAKAKLAGEEHKEVTIDDLIEAIALQYHLKIIPNKAEPLSEILKANIVGQDEAIKEITREMYGIDCKISNPLKPKLSMFFSGPTGCGKTETAKLLAKIYSGDDNGLVKINCGEYSDQFSFRRILGSDPGYVGYGEESDLVRSLKLKPESVILFDEIEKAHPEFVKVLLNILDEGYFKTGDGQEISCRNAIIIFTSNIGFSDRQHLTSIFPEENITNKSIKNMLSKKFLPEFVARLNKVIKFNALNETSVKAIAEKSLQNINETSELNITFTDEDFDDIIKNANIKEFGAREVQDLVRNKYLDKLIEKKSI